MDSTSWLSFAAIVAVVNCHSWITCTDYLEMNGEYWNVDLCRAFPRHASQFTNRNEQFGLDTGYNINNPPDNSPCRTSRDDSNAYDNSHLMAVYYLGQDIVITHPTKNHVADTRCTNKYIPDNGNFISISPVNPSQDPTLSQFKSNRIADLGKSPFGHSIPDSIINMYPKPGFQNAPKFCENPDKSLATNIFKLPDNMAPGRYTFLWGWYFNSLNDLYTSCWEADVFATRDERDSVIRNRGQDPRDPVIIGNLPETTPAPATTPAPDSTPAPTTTPAPTQTPALTQAPTPECSDYSDALGKSVLFYAAQRSGHLPDNDVPWRGDSAVRDGELIDADLSGGWYQDGNHVKFTFPMASSLTNLAWGLLEFGSGYQNAGHDEAARTSLRWGLDYLLKCRLSDTEVVALVGDPYQTEWLRPEDIPNQGASRPVLTVTDTNPGTDLVAEMAAALAAGSLVFRNSDAAYSTTLLENARALYNFAKSTPSQEMYSSSVNTNNKYKSNTYNSVPYEAFIDELVWSGLWLHNATGEQGYLDDALAVYPANQVDNQWYMPYDGHTWDDKILGAQVLLSGLFPSNAVYRADVTRALCAFTLHSSCTNSMVQSWMKKQFTPQGYLRFDQPQGLMKSGNAVMISLIAAKVTGIFENIVPDFADGQLDYILGKKTGLSHVAGFGSTYMQYIYHRAASCPTMPATCTSADFDKHWDPNPHVLVGAITGDVSGDDYTEDRRWRPDTNQPSLEQNAGWQTALAGIIQLRCSGSIATSTSSSSTTPSPTTPTTTPSTSTPANTTPSTSTSTTTATPSPTTPTTTPSTSTPANTTPSTSTPTTTATPSTTTSSTTSNPSGCSAKYDYAEVIRKSILFYEAQRSGALPSTNRIAWRGDSYLYDGSDAGIDLSGGWFNGGGQLKFNFPLAASITNLAWGLLEFKDAYVASDEYANALDSIKWPLIYLMKCHPSKFELYAQVGNATHDHNSFIAPEKADWNYRPSYKLDASKPGSDLAGEVAAAMAASSMVFQSEDGAFASDLLTHAKQLYVFGKRYRGKYSNHIPFAKDSYPSTGFKDELALAGLWLYKATGTDKFLNQAKNFYSKCCDFTGWGYSWDEKSEAAQLLMYLATSEDMYKAPFLSYMNNWIDGTNGITITPNGLRFRSEWGSLRYTANTAMLALIAHKHGVMGQEGLDFATQQINYVLGDNGRSYVVGFGNNAPQRPQHAAASNSETLSGWPAYFSPNPNPHILYGALVSGPDVNDVYEDNRQLEKRNGVSCDYNAGFQTALAGLKYFECAIGEQTTTSSASSSSSSTSTTQSSSSSTISSTTTSSAESTTTSSAAATTTTAPPVGNCPIPEKYDFALALHMSILFYEAQRSGELPDTNRIPWRGDSYLYDGLSEGLDLTKGWFDAGDQVKFNFPMAASVTNLAWGLLEFKDGYVLSNEYSSALDSIRWPLDYLINCHVSDNVFVGQVGNGVHDHSFWLAPEKADWQYRPVYKLDSSNPGSDLAGEVAAAMAASYLVFRDEDPAYAATLLLNSKAWFTFAKTYQGKYSDSISDAATFYPSNTGYNDELALASIWLYKATGEQSYLDSAKQYYSLCCNYKGWGYSWDEKSEAVQLLLHQVTGDDSYLAPFTSYMNDWINGGITITPMGLRYRLEWGSLRYAANTAFLGLVAYKNNAASEDAYTFAKQQINYMLGDQGRSLVVGFGQNPPQRPHHAAASVNDALYGWPAYHASGPNPHVLYGALVGGPDASDNYVDNREDFKRNEVTCDYNAGFQSALAALKYFECYGNN